MSKPPSPPDYKTAIAVADALARAGGWDGRLIGESVDAPDDFVPPSWADEDPLADVARAEMRRLAERWPHEPPRGSVPREVTKPELDFARHFHQHVMVPLRRIAWLNSVLLAHGLASWGEAFAAVMGFADSRGARYLSDAYYHDLRDAMAVRMAAFVAHHDDAGCPGNGPCSVPYPGDEP